MKLLDFNPIFGSTNPLLFTWEELGYTGGVTASIPHTKSLAESDKSNSKSKLMDSPELQDNVENSAHRLHDSSENGKGALSNLGSDDHSALQHSIEPCVDKEDYGEDSSDEASEVEFRVVLESNKVQPNMPLYGVPFDMIDASEGSAYSDLIEKLREKQLKDAED